MKDRNEEKLTPPKPEIVFPEGSIIVDPADSGTGRLLDSREIPVQDADDL